MIRLDFGCMDRWQVHEIERPVHESYTENHMNRLAVWGVCSNLRDSTLSTRAPNDTHDKSQVLLGFKTVPVCPESASKFCDSISARADLVHSTSPSDSLDHSRSSNWIHFFTGASNFSGPFFLQAKLIGSIKSKLFNGRIEDSDAQEVKRFTQNFCGQLCHRPSVTSTAELIEPSGQAHRNFLNFSQLVNKLAIVFWKVFEFLERSTDFSKNFQSSEI